jgi:hypothetical protein
VKNAISNKKTDTVILALLEHGSIEKAAAALGVCDVTLWRWLKKPLVAEAYRKAKRVDVRLMQLEEAESQRQKRPH